MKQYWIFVLNSLVNMAFCAVDSTFGNNISIDAIVVMGSFALIGQLGAKILFIGGYAYKVFQKYEKNCCLLSLIIGVLFGAVCIFGSNIIIHVFDLTDTQYEMLRQALICYGMCCPVEAVGRFLQSYITYKCYNKLVIILNVATYILLIGTDWLAVSLGWGCNGLVLSTGLSWLVYVIILLIATKFFAQSDKLCIKYIKKAFLVGKDLAVSGIIERGANLCLGYFVSTMGTEQYAIHSVALGAVSLAEEFRDAQNDYTIVRLRNRDKYKERKAKRGFKQCWIRSLLLHIIASFVLVIVMHGKVGLAQAIYGVALYCLPMLMYPVYDTVQQFAMSRGKTKYALANSFICVFWRVVALWILSSVFGTSLIIIACVYFFDYLSSTIYYLVRLRRDKRERMQG